MPGKEFKDFDDPNQPSSAKRNTSPRSRRDMLRGKLLKSELPVTSPSAESLPARSSLSDSAEEAITASPNQSDRIGRRRLLELSLLAASIMVPAGIGGYVIWNRNKPAVQAIPSFLSPTEQPNSKEPVAKTKETEDARTKKIVGFYILDLHANYPLNSLPNPQTLSAIDTLWSRNTATMDQIYSEAIDTAKADVKKQNNPDDPSRGTLTLEDELEKMKWVEFWRTFINNREKHGYNPTQSPDAFRQGSLLDSNELYSKTSLTRVIEIPMKDAYGKPMTSPGSSHSPRPHSQNETFSVKKLVADMVAEAVNPALKEKHFDPQNAQSVSYTDPKTIATLEELKQKLNSSTKLGATAYDTLIDDLTARMKADIIRKNPALTVLNPTNTDQIIYEKIFNGLLIDATTIAEWHRSRGM